MKSPETHRFQGDFLYFETPYVGTAGLTVTPSLLHPGVESEVFLPGVQTLLGRCAAGPSGHSRPWRRRHSPTPESRHAFRQDLLPRFWPDISRQPACPSPAMPEPRQLRQRWVVPFSDLVDGWRWTGGEETM